MLLDVLTMALVIKAQDEIAAKQLLKELTHCTSEEYQSTVVLKGAGLCGVGGKRWLVGLY